jgi:hypothetical protein
MVKPISLAVLKYKKVTADAIDKGFRTAVDVLQRGEVVGLPTDTADGTFDFDRFLHELRERVPGAKVVPVYCGPDDPEDAPGQHLLLGRSANEDYRQVAYIAQEVELWSAKDSSLLHQKRRTGTSPTTTASTTTKAATTSPSSTASLLFVFVIFCTNSPSFVEIK